ncbi:hypothetical protein Dimus_015347, partial [Dionaea muscipula]
MAAVFKRVQGLYGITANKAKVKILGADTADSEATPSQSNEPVSLQEIRPEEVATSQTQEQ